VNKGFDFNILPIMVINKVGMYIIIFKYKMHSHGKVLDFKIIQILHLLQFPCHFRYCSHDVNMNLRLNVSVKVRIPLPLPSRYNFWLALPIVQHHSTIFPNHLWPSPLPFIVPDRYLTLMSRVRKNYCNLSSKLHKITLVWLFVQLMSINTKIEIHTRSI
jgi:hypothetical protein